MIKTGTTPCGSAASRTDSFHLQKKEDPKETKDDSGKKVSVTMKLSRGQWDRTCGWEVMVYNAPSVEEGAEMLDAARKSIKGVIEREMRETPPYKKQNNS